MAESKSEQKSNIQECYNSQWKTYGVPPNEFNLMEYQTNSVECPCGKNFIIKRYMFDESVNVHIRTEYPDCCKPTSFKYE